MSLKDILNRDEEERERHLPVIEAPSRVEAQKSFRVGIRIGEKPHPFAFNHYISSVLVFLEQENRPPLLILKFEPFPPLVEPRFEFFLSIDRPSKLHVLASCNLHGLWEAEREIEVI